MQQVSLISHVKQAIHTLYHPTPQLDHGKADQFLRELTTKVEAWEIAGHLLLHSNVFEEKFFGAQILFLKLSQQWKTLNGQQQNQIRELLLTSILSSTSSKIVDKLCQSLSIFTLSRIVDSDEELSINSLFSTFTLPNVKLDYMNDGGDSHCVVQPFVIWLSYLAEQSSPYYFDTNSEAKIRGELNRISDTIVDYVVNVLKNNKNMTTQKLVLHCLLKWVEYGLPLKRIYNEIFDLSLKCITSMHLFEDSANIIHEIVIIRPEIMKYDECLKAYMKRMIETLSTLYDQAAKKNAFHICKEITKLMSAFGASHTEIIVKELFDSSSERDDGAVKNYGAEFIKFILMTCRHDYTQCQLTVEFWYNLNVQINSHFTRNQVQQQQQIIHGIFTQLLTIMIGQLGITEENADDEDFIAFRRESSDVLTSVYSVLYEEYMKICHNGMKQGIQIRNWQLVEASLFAVSSVHEYVRENQYLSIVPIIQAFNELPTAGKATTSADDSFVELKTTQVQLLGNYAHFCVKQSEDFLSHAIQFALNTVWQFATEQLEQRVAAVEALNSLCEKCCDRCLETLAKHMVQNMSTRLNELQSIDGNVQIKLLEATSSIVFGLTSSTTENTTQAQYYAELQYQLLCAQMQPIISNLNAHASTNKSTTQRLTNNDLLSITHEVNKIKSILKAFDGERSYTVVLKFIHKIWKPILLELLSLYKKYDAVVEAIAKLFECIACSVGVHPETIDLMHSMTMVMYELYYELLYPCALKVIAIITYGWENREASVYRSLVMNYPKICQFTFEHEEQFKSDERLIVEFYHLQSTILHSYPNLFLSSMELCELIIGHAVDCIHSFKSYEVASRITKFFTDLFRLGTKHPQYQQAFLQILQITSPLLVPACLRAVLFEAHPGSRELYKIFQLYKPYKRFLTTFTDNFIRFDQTVPALQNVPQAHRNAFANQLATSSTVAKIQQVIERFQAIMLHHEQQNA